MRFIFKKRSYQAKADLASAFGWTPLLNLSLRAGFYLQRKMYIYITHVLITPGPNNELLFARFCGGTYLQ